ncbi:MAG: SpoIIE family protein phosphatase [Candidatus Aminicenantaceae bacterium]
MAILDRIFRRAPPIPESDKEKGREAVSPLNRRVWRLVLVAAGGSVLLWLALQFLNLDDTLPAVAAGILALTTWAVAVRMLLLDARFKIFWLIWLLGGLALLLALPTTEGIWVASAAFAWIFLLFRKYRPFSHLTPRRRAALFLIALLMLSLLLFGMLTTRQEEVQIQISSQAIETTDLPANAFAALGKNLYFYALSALETFWFLSLFHLFFRIRLHFMRLRPKLAVSAFLLVLVPMFLVTVMGILTLYGTLGESRAIRASNIFLDWAEQVVRDVNFVHGLSPDSFVYTEGEGFTRQRGSLPPNIPPFIEALKVADLGFADWDPTVTGAYFLVEQDIWLVRLERTDAPGLSLWAGRIDRSVMDRLARILHSDLKISYTDRLSFGSGEGEEIQTLTVSGKGRPAGIYGRLPQSQPAEEGDEPAPSFWNRSLYFGVSSLSLMMYEDGQFSQQTVLLLLEGRLSDIAGELAGSRNPLSQAVLVLLLVLAILLLILEMFALFFGVRITAGITSAVRVLHRGTRRIAAGDLDSRIELPNEDELGDLAVSFNEMAAAVKKGREQAIARERLESELETARKIQERLLPHTMPEIPGFEIAGISLPSQQVGGDYFDFLDMGDGQLGIAIADVSGKGIPAALLMANLQASLHAQVIRPAEVGEVLSRINDLLVDSTATNMFATFFYGILDRSASAFKSTNAGHNPPLLLRKNGRIERLKSGGLLLGFMADQEYQQETAILEPGDVLVLFTDGVTEAVDSGLETVADSLFGEDRLIEVILEHRTGSAREIQSAILAAISEFTGSAPQSDDITLVVIKRQENSVTTGGDSR